MDILNLHAVTGGKTRVEAIKLFTDREGYERARRELEDALYSLPFLPPDQKRIVSRVDELMALCGELEAGLRAHERDGEALVEATVRALGKRGSTQGNGSC